MSHCGQRGPVSKSRTQRNRRSAYIFAKRNLPYPLLKTFDLPSIHERCARRSETTVAPQALMLLNSELILEAARAFADRVLRETKTAAPQDRVHRAYLLAFGRDPNQAELTAAVSFLQRQRSPFLTALADFCHVILNTSAFLYID